MAINKKFIGGEMHGLIRAKVDYWSATGELSEIYLNEKDYKVLIDEMPAHIAEEVAYTRHMKFYGVPVHYSPSRGISKLSFGRPCAGNDFSIPLHNKKNMQQINYVAKRSIETNLKGTEMELEGTHRHFKVCGLDKEGDRREQRHVIAKDFKSAAAAYTKKFDKGDGLTHSFKCNEANYSKVLVGKSNYDGTDTMFEIDYSKEDRSTSTCKVAAATMEDAIRRLRKATSLEEVIACRRLEYPVLVVVSK